MSENSTAFPVIGDPTVSSHPLNQIELERAAPILGLDPRPADGPAPLIEKVVTRSINRDEIVALADAARSASPTAAVHPESFDAYLLDKAGFLVPATFAIWTKVKNVLAVEEHPEGNGRVHDAQPARVVGHGVDVAVETIFGRNTDLRLYTTDEAASSMRARNGGRIGQTIYVPVKAGENHAQARPIVPVYGSQATVSVIVEDITPEALAADFNDFLAAKYGERATVTTSVKTRPVANHRVDVYQRGVDDDARPVAINLLEAEAFKVGGNGCETRTHIVGSTSLLIGR